VSETDAKRSPLYSAQHAARYDRRALIEEYERAYDCRLIVIFDNIFPYTISLLEELIYDANPKVDLHLLLATPGGDGETAVRIIRSAQARCQEFTVIVPDLAKSAGTIIVLGAHHIIMSATSDLGPIDPQFQLKPGSLSSARDIIAAVDDAAQRIQAAPATYPLFASLLSDVTAIIVQQARSSTARTGELLEAALAANPSRDAVQVAALKEKLSGPLIESPKSHAAVFGAKEAIAAGLPVKELLSSDPQWQLIWKLWTRYFALNQRVYESRSASQVLSWSQPTTK